MKKQRKNKGFTIVELIVVMAIIAVLILIAVPTFTKYLEDANKTSELGSASNIYKSAITTATSESLNGPITVAAAKGTDAAKADSDIEKSIIEGVSNTFSGDEIIVNTYVKDSVPTTSGNTTQWVVYYYASGAATTDKVDISEDIYLFSPTGNRYKNGSLDN